MPQAIENAAIPTANTRRSDSNRRHDIDALRVCAFGMLILYHLGMFYVADWGWHVKSTYQTDWLQLPMNISNQWRMALIFLISGLAVNFVWGKYSAGHFAARRIWRLLIPLVFGMAIIVAPQAYFQALSNGVIEPGFFRFMAEYLTFKNFSSDAWDGAEIITWTWNHLWYLPYLLCYTLALIPLALFVQGPGAALRRGFQKLRGTWLILIPVVPLMLYGTFIFPHFPYQNHALLNDWYAHAMFFTIFFYGFLIGRDKGLWTELAEIRKVTLLLAIVSFVLYRMQGALLGTEPTLWQEQAAMFIIYLNRWLWIVTVLGWGHCLLNRPFKWLPYATEAVYPWYILHQTIIVVAGYQLSRLALGPVVEPFLLLAITIGGCFVLHEYVIRRTSILRPLFGLSHRVLERELFESQQAAKKGPPSTRIFPRWLSRNRYD